MGDRRMFAKAVVCNDAFLDMSHEAQALYLQLGVNTDEDGFIVSPRAIMRTCGCKQEHLDELEKNGFIISFPSGVIVQRHFKVNNSLRKDRKTDTAYQEEFSHLTEDRNKCYELIDEGCQPSDNQMETSCQPSDNQMETEEREERKEERQGKESEDKIIQERERERNRRRVKEGCGKPLEKEPTPKRENYKDEESYHSAFNDWVARNCT